MKPQNPAKIVKNPKPTKLPSYHTKFLFFAHIKTPAAKVPAPIKNKKMLHS
jgi:hypothetical protein